jgi:hypothetical protein
MATWDTSIPIVYQGQRFPSRTALAEYLAPRCGKTVSTMQTLLSRYDGDVERAVAPHPPKLRPFSFEGQAFPSRKALAIYLAPRLNRPAQSVESLLIYHHDDIAAVLAAQPYRPTSPRPPHSMLEVPRRRSDRAK